MTPKQEVTSRRHGRRCCDEGSICTSAPKHALVCKTKHTLLQPQVHMYEKLHKACMEVYVRHYKDMLLGQSAHGAGGTHCSSEYTSSPRLPVTLQPGFFSTKHTAKEPVNGRHPSSPSCQAGGTPHRRRPLWPGCRQSGDTSPHRRLLRHNGRWNVGISPRRQPLRLARQQSGGIPHH